MAITEPWPAGRRTSPAIDVYDECYLSRYTGCSQNDKQLKEIALRVAGLLLRDQSPPETKHESTTPWLGDVAPKGGRPIAWTDMGNAERLVKPRMRSPYFSGSLEKSNPPQRYPSCCSKDAPIFRTVEDVAVRIGLGFKFAKPAVVPRLPSTQ